MSPEPFVTAEDVAKHLKISRRQVLELSRKGLLPGHPVCLGTGRRMWRFRLSEVDEVIVARTAKSEIGLPAICNKMAAGSPRSQKEQSNG